MKALLAAALLCGLALPAAAQNAITQEGTTVKDAPVMLKGNNRARQGATVNGAPSGQIVTTGDAVVGGRCDYSAPTDAVDGYYRLCLDAKTGTIKLDGTKLPALGTIKIEVNGQVYDFPASAAIVGSDAAVASNAALKIATGAVGKRLVRLGFTTAGDGGIASYNWSDTTCAYPDDGAQVQPTGVTGCWLADFAATGVNVRQFGAKGDCVADDSAAFVAAMGHGLPVHVPNGHYLIKAAMSFSSLPVKLYGDGYGEGSLTPGQICNLNLPGSYLVQKDPGFSIFSLTGAEIRGSLFERFAVLQQHPDPAIADWAPTVYPPVWALHDTLGQVDFKDIGLGGVYAAIDAIGNTSRVNMRGIRGQVFSFLFRVENALDLSKMSDIHIWPFWDNRQSTLTWQNNNTDLVVLSHQDSLQVNDFFALGQQSCFRLKSGPPTAIHINSLNCDVTKYSIWQDNTSTYATISVNQLWHGGGTLTSGVPVPGGSVIQLDGVGAKVKIDDLNVVITEASVVNQTNTGSGAFVSIGALSGYLGGWNWSGGAPYAGTATTIHDVSSATSQSVYTFNSPIWPQNAGINCCAGRASGIINEDSHAQLYMASGMDQAWYAPLYAASGATINWPPWASRLILRPAATSLSVVLPDTILDGSELTMWCDLTITTLLVTNTNVSLSNPPTSCANGQSFRFVGTYGPSGAVRTLH